MAEHGARNAPGPTPDVTLIPASSWDGLDVAELRRRLGVPDIAVYATVDSTQDVAHRMAAAGAPSGSIVLADAQHAGRGRQGRTWASAPGRGVWCTIIERPADATAVDVLSLRVGLHLAEALDGLAGQRVAVKWPNDLLLRDGKVAGILVEARWSGANLAWVAVGVGINVLTPGVTGAAGLPSGARRWQVLHAVVRAVDAAAAARGGLTTDELSRYGSRDLLAGRRITAPGRGTARGIDASGALVVETPQGRELHRTGTIQLAEES